MAPLSLQQGVKARERFTKPRAQATNFKDHFSDLDIRRSSP